MAPLQAETALTTPVVAPVVVTHCHTCGSDAYRLAFGSHFPQIVACHDCGLIYTRELLPWNVLAQKYVTGEFSPLLYYQQTVPADLLTAAEDLTVLGRHITPGRLLDVGCCMGTYMRVAIARGWTTHGLDINPASVAACQAQGLSAEAGQADDMRIPVLKYDACHMGDVIEHMVHPIETLRRIRSALKPGGVLVVTTPNMDNWAGRLWQVKPGEHILYFTPATLKRMLHEAGFGVKAVGAYDRHLYLPALRQSTTFKNRAGILLLIAALSRLFAGRQAIKLPLGEHLRAVAVAP